MDDERIYLKDISDNKIKVHLSYSINEEDNKIADDALVDFWSREILG
ncbi:hypothetical protein [Aquibacillus kalidii]|nr:hypothetical protein [Aquibacillus kalidii]